MPFRSWQRQTCPRIRVDERFLKVARTLADLEEAPAIRSPHILGAIRYRSLDRNLFAWIREPAIKREMRRGSRQ